MRVATYCLAVECIYGVAHHILYNFRGSELSDVSVVRKLPNVEVLSLRYVFLFTFRIPLNVILRHFFFPVLTISYVLLSRRIMHCKFWGFAYCFLCLFFSSYFSSACEFRFIERIGAHGKQNPDIQ